MIPYGKHYIDEDDITAVVDVLRNGWITQGPKVPELEAAISNFVGSSYAVAVSSATAALHIAYLAAGLGKDSKVVTTPNTFVASANCILYGGGIPIFCDINPLSLNMDVQNFEDIFEKERHITAVIPVHFGGLPCDMNKIHNIASSHGIKVIEDASQAFGAKYDDGSLVGNCKYSDMTVFSLHPVKGITSGEGGIITTNNKILYNRLLSLRSHGINKGNFELLGTNAGDQNFINPDMAFSEGIVNPWYYEMQELGFNYRITDFQCALVLSQLNKSNMFMRRRKEIAYQYDELLGSLENVSLTQTGTRNQSSNHLFVVRIDFDEIGKKRGQVMRELSVNGIGTQVHYIPVTRQPYYVELGFIPEDYPEVEKYYSQALTIPIFYGLESGQIEDIVKHLKAVVS